MKDYLVDIPVEVQIWIRPELQKKQFDVIKKAKPSVLFVCSDGGRNDSEWEKIKLNRKLYDEEIDWKCKVYKLYASKNHGLYTFLDKIYDLVWNNVDRCIFFEDDHLPAVSYFKFCAELLDKYKNDERISFINGVNLQGVTKECHYDYFFARSLSVGGHAMWKRTFDDFKDMSYRNDEYTIKLLKKLTNENKYSRNVSHWKQIETYVNNDYCFGHVPATEFFLTFSFFAKNQLAIVPKYNMISDMGVGIDATHSDVAKNYPKSVLKIYNRPLYELNFPIKMNKFVMPNLFYEEYRNVFFALNNPIKYYYRLFVRFVLIIKNNGLSTAIKKTANYFKNRNTKIKREN